MAHVKELMVVWQIFVGVVAIAVMWGGIVVRMKQHGVAIEEKMDKKEHVLRCKNSTLRFEKHVTKEFQEFEAKIIPIMKDLVKELREKNGSMDRTV